MRDVYYETSPLNHIYLAVLLVQTESIKYNEQQEPVIKISSSESLRKYFIFGEVLRKTKSFLNKSLAQRAFSLFLFPEEKRAGGTAGLASRIVDSPCRGRGNIGDPDISRWNCIARGPRAWRQCFSGTLSPDYPFRDTKRSGILLFVSSSVSVSYRWKHSRQSPADTCGINSRSANRFAVRSVYVY